MAPNSVVIGGNGAAHVGGRVPIVSVLIKRLVLSAVIAALLFPVSLSAQAGPRTINTQELTQTKNGGKDWITHGGALNNQRYSALDQINTTNVAQLRGMWMTRLGSGLGAKYRFEADPLVVDGVMYIPTGNDDIFALDAKTGRKLWEWQSDIPQNMDLICCGWDNRGLAVGDGRVYSGMLDGSFVALDQQTGKLLWRTQLEDYHDGYSLTGAYRYYDGLVFAGISGGEEAARGRLTALDAKTGTVAWVFYTIPAPGEPFSDTWPSPNDPDPQIANAWQWGGATIWQAPAIDPELGMLYFSTGNASPNSGGDIRKGDNLFSASIVALDYKTGQYKWHFQEVHHDLWDFDAPSPVVLFDQMYDGQMRKGLYQAGKTGWLYFLDRTNGKPLIGIDEKPVEQEPRQFTSPTQPYPVGDSFIYQCPDAVPGFLRSGCIFAAFWDIATLTRPTGHGGSEWSPTTYDPQTGYAYVMGSEQTSASAMRPSPYVHGKSYGRGGTATPLGSSIGNTFTAMDSRTNKIVWQKREGGDQSYGALSTAGGLVFRGKVDGNLVAYDARSGDQLWSFQTGLGISAPPMTWSDGKDQFVTVAVGGNRGGQTTLDGDEVWTFSLNGLFDQQTAPPPPATTVEITGNPIKLGAPMGTTNTLLGDRIFEGTVDVVDYLFQPQQVLVPRGTTVTFNNAGTIVHTATAQDNSWDTGDIAPGQVASLTFDNAGTWIYNCSPHPWMIGKLIVQ
jgi:quinohemoprotein ethanol dehydrogenase